MSISDLRIQAQSAFIEGNPHRVDQIDMKWDGWLNRLLAVMNLSFSECGNAINSGTVLYILSGRHENHLRMHEFIHSHLSVLSMIRREFMKHWEDYGVNHSLKTWPLYQNQMKTFLLAQQLNLRTLHFLQQPAANRCASNWTTSQSGTPNPMKYVKWWVLSRGTNIATFNTD